MMACLEAPNAPSVATGSRGGTKGAGGVRPRILACCSGAPYCPKEVSDIFLTFDGIAMPQNIRSFHMRPSAAGQKDGVAGVAQVAVRWARPRALGVGRVRRRSKCRRGLQAADMLPCHLAGMGRQGRGLAHCTLLDQVVCLRTAPRVCRRGERRTHKAAWMCAQNTRRASRPPRQERAPMHDWQNGLSAPRPPADRVRIACMIRAYAVWWLVGPRPMA